MKVEVAIICSRADPASLNIFERLQELESWQQHGEYRTCGKCCLLILEDKLTDLHRVDDRLAGLGLHPELVVFACRHVSKTGIPWLGGHFTGAWENDEHEISAAAPWALRSFLHNVSKYSQIGFEISAEATHHGPTDMRTPTFFAEIGSGELQWRDTNAGNIVAKAILALEFKDLPVLLGFGGGHYVQRQTRLMFEAEIAFGHIFSSYQTKALDADLVDYARQKSGATYAYIDRKSFRSVERKRIESILEDIGLPILKSKDIRAKFPLEKTDRLL